ncbi:MAG: hypothetical protein H3C38_09345 [Rhodospirillales bacterium]|nr:hypothetical protein [Rhodospirillales bacterium]
MRWWRMPLLLLTLAATPAVAEECAACHPREAAAFAASAMATAAASPAFRDEWTHNGRNPACLGCHAPSGGAGVICRDCHDADHHPVARLPVVATCARCHDAPGEVAVRSFLAGPAAGQGRQCLDCHASGDGGHGFAGPSRPGFLDGIARVTLNARRAGDGWTLVATIAHTAGHDVPGGTTGRSVWLEVVGYDGAGKVRFRDHARFGWVRTPDGEWKDLLLRVGKIAIVEVADAGRMGVRRIEAALLYLRDAGHVDGMSNQRKVLLDKAGLNLPDE